MTKIYWSVTAPSARWTLKSMKLKDYRAPTRCGLLFTIIANKLNLYSAERRLEKEKCSFYCILHNKSMYVMCLQGSNGSRQLSATVHLLFYIFNFQSLDLSLLHACFWGVLYVMLLGKMEIISSVEPFYRTITFLEVIGLHGFGCWLHVASQSSTPL